MKRVAVAALALTAALAGCRTTQPAGPPTTLAELSLDRLRADFNRDEQRPRLLALVSPS